MSIAIVFPGQGSQHVGMGKDLFDHFDEVKKLYEEASSALGYDVGVLSFSGPKDELNRTYRTQPCLLTAGIAAFRVLVSKGVRPAFVAGHSLGEYSAVVAAGVISFYDAVRLTEQRGTFMQEAVPEGQGLMAAVIGLNRDKVDEICLSVTSGYVAPANYNTPEQTVIAGERRPVEEAMALLSEAGAKRVVPLEVSAPSHCRLMDGASGRLEELLRHIRFSNTSTPLVNNADALFLTDGGEIKLSLIRQLNSPLRWEDSIKNMVRSGVDTFIEAGPGRVLSGLIKRIDPSVKILNVSDTATLQKTLEALSIRTD